MFCEVDDFCKWFAPLYTHRLPQSGWCQGTRQMTIALSEIMIIIVPVHCSHYRDFKHDNAYGVSRYNLYDGIYAQAH